MNYLDYLSQNLSFWRETNFCKNNRIIHIQPIRLSSVLSLRGPRLEEAGRVSVSEWSRERQLRWGVAVKDFKGPDKHNVVLGLLI